MADDDTIAGGVPPTAPPATQAPADDDGPIDLDAAPVEETADDSGDAPAEPEDKPTRKRGAEARIAELTGRLRSQERANAAALEQLARMRQMVSPEALAGASDADYDALVQRQATVDTVAQMRTFELQESHRTYQEGVNSLFAARVEAVRDQLPDLEAVYEKATLSDLGMAFVAHSDKGPQVAYWLGKNPRDADRIANLPPVDQAVALARLENQVTMPARRGSSTPPPARTLGNGRAASSRDVGDMSMDEYAKHRAAKGK